QDWWGELSQLMRDAAPVFDECLAFVQGSWARRHDLDEGLCTMADDLLEDLAYRSDIGWTRFTLLATSEFYRDTADIIRIAYPDVSFWSLPLAAHEFGHYIGPELVDTRSGRREYPLQTRLKEADAALPAQQKVGVQTKSAHTKKWQHLQEHFAD